MVFEGFELAVSEYPLSVVSQIMKMISEWVNSPLVCGKLTGFKVPGSGPEICERAPNQEANRLFHRLSQI